MSATQQPPTPPAGWGPPPPPVAEKKKPGCAKIGCGIFGVLILIGIIAGALGAKTTTTTTTSSGPDTTQTTDAGSQDGTAPTTAPAAPKMVLKASGNGTRNIPPFTTGDNWNVAYTYDCTGFYGGTGNFTVYVDYPGGDVAVNELGAKGNSSSAESGAGEHTLKVASECKWTLTITS